MGKTASRLTQGHDELEITGIARALAEDLGILLPPSLVDLWADPAADLGGRLYDPRLPASEPMSLDSALAGLATARLQPTQRLVPLTFVDDRSFACVVCQAVGQSQPPNVGQVIRWHLDSIPRSHQGALLDVNPRLYAQSLAEELGPGWDEGYKGMAAESERYQKDFVATGTTPKAWNLRPFQLACQNVIIGLSAMQNDPVIDGLSVPYWMTCEVPHVATNEGSRALTALMLCDAFQSGGTMEIDFRHHPEHRVPAALRRFGRTLGLALGEEIEGGESISPGEARQLFLAVTPMPPRLRARVDEVVAGGIMSPERLCYSLLSPIWPAVELEFLLRCSRRFPSILRGGADVGDRRARLAELEMARAALMAGTLFRRLDSKDTAGGRGLDRRVFEDSSQGVEWRVLDEFAAVEFSGLPDGPLPWQGGSARLEPKNGRILVVPRPHPLHADLEALTALTGMAQEVPVLLVAPRDADLRCLPPGSSLLTCPDRLSDLDAQVERRFQSSRLVRA